ncbi:MAG: hypothetical protein MN733_08780, partial [Nitrososphaera sp.]|nr:hypothetical protein [Nitrososphaera sp.]
GCTVLVPIRLDAAIIEVQSGWVASIRRERCIGDFCNWKDDCFYKIAFERLMHALAAEEVYKW